MKISKSQLKQIIKEELSEIKTAQAGAMPFPSGTDQGEEIVKQHLGKIVADLAEGRLLPHLPSTMPDSGHTAVVPDLDRLAAKMYQMIIAEMGAT
jgi:hypothetical protein